MARTTPTLVSGIIQTQDGIDLSPFITMANTLVNAICVAPVNASKTNPYLVNPYPDTGVNSQMELIERWLAAHFYTVFDNQISAAKAGSAFVSFQYKTDYGLKSSMYGQQAMILDINGGLAAYDNSIKVKKHVQVKIGSMGPPQAWPLQTGLWPDISINS